MIYICPGRASAGRDIFMMEEFTRAQLALRNGSDRDEIWIAYKGIIYDVTGNFHWPNGYHYRHWSGQDLTAELEDAPHTDSVFRRLKVVGKLV